MKIFIGSSSSGKRRAESIAKSLEKVGFIVYRWWSEKVFEGGDITLEKLIKMSDICDGAVFIFNKDDKMIISNKDNTKIILAPRDNVILEYGLFVSKNGIKKTLFVVDSKVKVPTDLKGITYNATQRGYLNRLTNNLLKAFTEEEQQQNQKITAHLNLKLINSLSDGGEDSWKSRKLYLGEDGARLWKNVENCSYYRGDEQFREVSKAIATLLKNDKININKFSTMISFGPGLGNYDKKIIGSISPSGFTINYIPIDINIYLATYSAEKVSATAKNINVPFCVIGDFEDGMSGISNTIHEYTSSGRVFLMLGGTFGNLENETSFIHGLRDILQEDDIAIIDIFTTNKTAYKHEHDPLFDIVNQKSQATKDFILNGINNRTTDNITDYIKTEKIEQKHASDIPDTFSFEFKSIESNSSLITVRRYNHNAFEKYLIENNFDIIATKKVNKNELIQHSIFILKKTTRHSSQ